MCDEDARDEEASQIRALAEGDFHKVTMDVVVRIKVDALGATHETEDLEDMVTGDALAEGEVLNVEEIK